MGMPVPVLGAFKANRIGYKNVSNVQTFLLDKYIYVPNSTLIDQTVSEFYAVLLSNIMLARNIPTTISR